MTEDKQELTAQKPHESRPLEADSPRSQIYLVAAAVSFLLILLVAGLFYYYWTRPPERALDLASLTPRLEGALRAGEPGFEQAREQIVVERPQAKESTRALGDVVMELVSTVRNNTGRTITGLEVRGTVLGPKGEVVKERIEILVLEQEAELAPGESMNVRLLLEGMRPEEARADVRLVVTGIRFE